MEDCALFMSSIRESAAKACCYFKLVNHIRFYAATRDNEASRFQIISLPVRLSVFRLVFQVIFSSPPFSLPSLSVSLALSSPRFWRRPRTILIRSGNIVTNYYPGSCCR